MTDSTGGRGEAPADLRVEPGDITIARKEVFGDFTDWRSGPTAEDVKVAEALNRRLSRRSAASIPSAAGAPQESNADVIGILQASLRHREAEHAWEDVETAVDLLLAREQPAAAVGRPHPEALVALQRIADGGDCRCEDHEAPECCANTPDFCCPECIAQQCLDRLATSLQSAPSPSTERFDPEPRKQHSIELLRKTLSTLTNYIWTKQLRPGEHLWSIPADHGRDFDCILSDAISELERLRAGHGGVAPQDREKP